MHFKTLFGIPTSDIQETCVVTSFHGPIVRTAFELTEPVVGSIYTSGQAPEFTVITAPPGAPYAGDAALYLKEAGCRRFIWIGSSVLIHAADENTNVGNVVAPKLSLALESFSDLIHRRTSLNLTYTDQEWLSRLEPLLTDHRIDQVQCATLGSLKLIDHYRGFLGNNNINVADLELSAFFNAASSLDLPAIAFLYIRDKNAADEQQHIQDALTRLNKLITAIVRQDA